MNSKWSRGLTIVASIAILMAVKTSSAADRGDKAPPARSRSEKIQRHRAAIQLHAARRARRRAALQRRKARATQFPAAGSSEACRCGCHRRSNYGGRDARANRSGSYGLPAAKTDDRQGHRNRDRRAASRGRGRTAKGPDRGRAGERDGPALENEASGSPIVAHAENGSRKRRKPSRAS